MFKHCTSFFSIVSQPSFLITHVHFSSGCIILQYYQQCMRILTPFNDYLTIQFLSYILSGCSKAYEMYNLHTNLILLTQRNFNFTQLYPSSPFECYCYISLVHVTIPTIHFYKYLCNFMSFKEVERRARVYVHSLLY